MTIADATGGLEEVKAELVEEVVDGQ